MPSPRRASTLAPRIEGFARRELGDGAPELLTARADLDGLSFGDIDTPLLDLSAATVHDAAFGGVSAREGDWRSARLHDTTFDRLEVPVLRAQRGIWRNVEVRETRLGSVEAYEASWHSVHFVGCKLTFVNLRGAELMDVAFTDCIVEELDLGQAGARRVGFGGTRVSRLVLQQARLEHVDLRAGSFEEVSGLDGLRGATISPLQLELLAPLLAEDRGIKVEDAGSGTA